MRTWFSLLFFLTIGMSYFGYTIEPLTVTDVRSCWVTMDDKYTIFSDEAWRIGDRAEAIVRGEEILEVRYKWR